MLANEGVCLRPQHFEGKQKKRAARLPHMEIAVNSLSHLSRNQKENKKEVLETFQSQ